MKRDRHDIGDVFAHIRQGRQSVHELLYHTLRRAIVSGRFAPGEHLVEREIAAMASVSRTPIREAFRRLEAEGLVKHDPRRGVRVIGVETQKVDDVFAVRKALQGLMAERAALNATQQDLNDLERAVAEGEALTGHYEGFMLTQDRFNDAFYRAANLPLAEGFVRQLADYLEEFRGRSLWNSERRAAAAAEHRAIYEAILQRDPVRARKECCLHAKKSASRVKQVLLEQ